MTVLYSNVVRDHTKNISHRILESTLFGKHITILLYILLTYIYVVVMYIANILSKLPN